MSVCPFPCVQQELRIQATVALCPQALMTDTVGFIQKLPTQLVAAFRATLEEIKDASLILHVVDVSHPNAAAQSAAVMRVRSGMEWQSFLGSRWSSGLKRPTAVQQRGCEGDAGHAIASGPGAAAEVDTVLACMTVALSWVLFQGCNRRGAELAIVIIIGAEYGSGCQDIVLETCTFPEQDLACQGLKGNNIGSTEISRVAD